MAKSKHAPALFEVIGTHKDPRDAAKLALPTWWKRGEEVQTSRPAESAEPAVEPAAEDPAPAAPVRQPEPPVELVGEPVAESAGQPAAEPVAVMPRFERPVIRESEPSAVAGSGDPAGPPLVRLRSGRVEVSLNPVGAVVVVGGVALALLCSYFAGRAVGPVPPAQLQANAEAEGYDEVEEALGGTPDGRILEPAGTAPPAAPSTVQRSSPPAAERTRVERPSAGASAATPPAAGPNRVVLQTFPSEHRRSAEFSRDLFARNGIETTLASVGGSWRLVSARGFDLRDPAQNAESERLKQAVIDLGTVCNRELIKAGLPNYTFAEPFMKKFE